MTIETQLGMEERIIQWIKIIAILGAGIGYIYLIKILKSIEKCIKRND